MNKHIRVIKKFIITLFRSIFRARAQVEDGHTLSVHLDHKTWQRMNRLMEKSGVKDHIDLNRKCYALFELIVNHELQGGVVRLIDSDGTEMEFVNLLDHINNKPPES